MRRFTCHKCNKVGKYHEGDLRVPSVFVLRGKRSLMRVMFIC
jgi:hypothetical protein